MTTEHEADEVARSQERFAREVEEFLGGSPSPGPEEPAPSTGEKLPSEVENAIREFDEAVTASCSDFAPAGSYDLVRAARASLERAILAYGRTAREEALRLRAALTGLGYHAPGECPHGMSHWIGGGCAYDLPALVTNCLRVATAPYPETTRCEDAQRKFIADLTAFLDAPEIVREAAIDTVGRDRWDAFVERMKVALAPKAPATSSFCGCNEHHLCEVCRVEGHACGEDGVFCDSDAHCAMVCPCGSAAWVVYSETSGLRLVCARCGKTAAEPFPAPAPPSGETPAALDWFEVATKVSEERDELRAALQRMREGLVALAAEWEKDRAEWRKLAAYAYARHVEGVQAAGAVCQEREARAATCRDHAAALRSLATPDQGEHAHDTERSQG